MQNYYRFKSLFFPLHPDNCKGFASSELVIIGKFCLKGWQIPLHYVKKFVSASIQDVRPFSPSVYIIHFMDILLSDPSEGVLLQSFALT